MRLGTRYDLLNAALFLPAGGSSRLRHRLVRALDVRPGHRVLELGCGTGQVTAHLVAAGAQVTAVDALPEMLDAARRRAPQATFVEGDVTTIDLTTIEAGHDHDRVVLSFVLHNFDAPTRQAVLRRSAGALRDGGLVGVLDWAAAGPGLAGALRRRLVTAIEPSPTAAELLDGALAADVERAGLHVQHRRRVANGRAEILVLRP